MNELFDLFQSCNMKSHNYVYFLTNLDQLEEFNYELKLKRKKCKINIEI